ncbi:MAG TPA: sigma-70 family RNA polymerase sigma factor [Planctomycetaceae bacterium]|nr:sigma-70 family RNA polymerase sigma factor [Planctomycetaceae bacterium]
MPTDWDTIVRDNAAVVLNAAFRVLGRLADAEDVAQEVFLEAFRKWPAAHNEWPGLLKRMAVCRAIDALRARRLPDPLPEGELPDRECREPGEELLAGERQQLLRAALAQLAPREAEVFCLHHFEGANHARIAELLGIEYGAVATALSKARTKIRAAVVPVEQGD